MRLNILCLCLITLLLISPFPLAATDECSLGKQKKVPVLTQPEIRMEDYGSAWVDFYVDLSHLPFWTEKSKVEVSVPVYDVDVKVDKKIPGTALTFDPDGYCVKHSPNEVHVAVFDYHGVTLHVQTKEQEVAWEKLFEEKQKAAKELNKQKRSKNYKTIQPPR